MKALVSHSGGVDSTTCLAMAVEDFGAKNVSTVSFIYGQKLDKELECAAKLAEFYGVNHYIVNLSEVFQYSDCSLLKKSTQKVAQKTYFEQVQKNGSGIISSYVPFRNGVFLASVASVALSVYPCEEVSVYIGAQANDSVNNTYADCSVSFVEAMNRAIQAGTYKKVQLVAPIVNMSKAQVIATGLRLKVPYELTWTCYEGGEKPCGKCAACQDRVAAFRANGFEDPVRYKGE